MDKIAFIDVDGTLTSPNGISSWEKVHTYFNLIDKMEDHSSRFFSGEITYAEWALLDVGLWKGKNISDLDKALNPPDLIPGAQEGVRKLKEAGYVTILLSGGIDVMVNEVAKLVGADYSYSNVIGHKKGKIDGTVKVLVGVKSEIIKELQVKHKFDLTNTVAIGDNFNDIDMFELVGKSIAINPKTDSLIQVATEVVYTSNFEEAVDKLLSN